MDLIFRPQGRFYFESTRLLRLHISGHKSKTVLEVDERVPNSIPLFQSPATTQLFIGKGRAHIYYDWNAKTASAAGKKKLVNQFSQILNLCW